jgi:GTP-binding protein
MAGEDFPQTGGDAGGIDADALEAGRLLFAGPVTFERGVVAMADLPDATLPEVAFAGRSNVGKSSLINALTGRNGLARASAEPGRTRELNFFRLGERARLVDMPGYGYAKAGKADIARWTALVRDYLRGRPGLARVFLLIDARHGLKDNDYAVMDLLDETAVVYQVVLTKTDKLSDTARESVVGETVAALRKRPAAHPRTIAVSAHTNAAIETLRAEIATLCA